MAGFPEELKYTADHEWVRAGNANVVRVGITEYAAEQLGDIVFVSLPTVGESVETGDAVGELESTKSVSDVFAPLPGVVSAINDALDGAPETVGSDPYGDGWLFELELTGDADVDDLLDADAYTSEIGA